MSSLEFSRTDFPSILQMAGGILVLQPRSLFGQRYYLIYFSALFLSSPKVIGSFLYSDPKNS